MKLFFLLVCNKHIIDKIIEGCESFMLKNNDNLLNKLHEEGKKNANKVLPEEQLNIILGLVFDCLQNKKTPEEAANELYDEYKPAINGYIDAFKKGTPEHIYKSLDKKIEKHVGNVKEGFSKECVLSAISIHNLMKSFMNDEMNEVEFIEKFFDTGVKDVIKDMAEMSNIDLDKLLNIEISIAAYIAFSEAYKILMSALEDASIAYERRIEIETKCKQNIELIKSYRNDIEEKVYKYFDEYLNEFERGLKEINEAIMNNDTNGYIKGNVILQKKLKYDVQFTNQEEFDELMSSNKSFKL